MFWIYFHLGATKSNGEKWVGVTCLLRISQLRAPSFEAHFHSGHTRSIVRQRTRPGLIMALIRSETYKVKSAVSEQVIQLQGGAPDGAGSEGANSMKWASRGHNDSL